MPFANERKNERLSLRKAVEPKHNERNSRSSRK